MNRLPGLCWNCLLLWQIWQVAVTDRWSFISLKSRTLSYFVPSPHSNFQNESDQVLLFLSPNITNNFWMVTIPKHTCTVPLSNGHWSWKDRPAAHCARSLHLLVAVGTHHPVSVPHMAKETTGVWDSINCLRANKQTGHIRAPYFQHVTPYMERFGKWFKWNDWSWHKPSRYIYGFVWKHCASKSDSQSTIICPVRVVILGPLLGQTPVIFSVAAWLQTWCCPMCGEELTTRLGSTNWANHETTIKQIQKVQTANEQTYWNAATGNRFGHAMVSPNIETTPVRTCRRSWNHVKMRQLGQVTI